jgi:hypothetical protein
VTAARPRGPSGHGRGLERGPDPTRGGDRRGRGAAAARRARSTSRPPTSSPNSRREPRRSGPPGLRLAERRRPRPARPALVRAGGLRCRARTRVAAAATARLPRGRSLPTPTCIERGKGDGVSRVDRQDRLELAREVPVHGPLVERDLVDRHRASVRAGPGDEKTRSWRALSVSGAGFEPATSGSETFVVRPATTRTRIAPSSMSQRQLRRLRPAEVRAKFEQGCGGGRQPIVWAHTAHGTD